MSFKGPGGVDLVDPITNLKSDLVISSQQEAASREPTQSPLLSESEFGFGEGSSSSTSKQVFKCPWEGCNKEFTEGFNLKS
ncbi:hypothetical protein HDU99_004224, partial [Rhizoclosmatium hyalinum]